MSSTGGFGGPPPIFSTFFILILVVIVGIIVFRIAKSTGTWMSNNAAVPVSASCRVAAKRTEVRGGSGNTRAKTSYYITFEFDDGKRLELPVGGNQYGMIAEGDHGIVDYQGTRFNGFRRN